MKNSINRRMFLTGLAAIINTSCWGDKPFPTASEIPEQDDDSHYDYSFKNPNKTETHTLTGTVFGVGDNRYTLKDAVVKIYDSQGNLARQDTSDANGNFRAELASKGIYRIIVSHPEHNAKLYPDQITLEDSLNFNPCLLHSSIDQKFFYALKKKDNKPLTTWDISKGYADPSAALINPTDLAFRDIAVDILKNYISKASGDKLKPKEPYAVYDPYLIPNTSTDTVKADVKIYWRPANTMNGMAAAVAAHVNSENYIYGANIYVADNLSANRKTILLEAITKALFDIANTSDDYRLFTSSRNDYSAEGLKILKAISLLEPGW